jgi:hypothetical protein
MATSSCRRRSGDSSSAFPSALPRSAARDGGRVACVRAADVGIAVEALVTGRRYKDLARPDFPGARELIRTIGSERLWNELAFRVPRWAQLTSPWTAAEQLALAEAAERAARSQPQHRAAP